MKKYELLDSKGNILKYNDRLPDKLGRWWYYAGQGCDRWLLVKQWEEDDTVKAVLRPTSDFNVIVKKLPDFNIVTRQGYKIIAKWGHEGETHIIIRRDHADGTKDYAWCTYYDTQNGTWTQGHYDYTNAVDAQKALLRFMYDTYVE